MLFDVDGRAGNQLNIASISPARHAHRERARCRAPNVRARSSGGNDISYGVYIYHMPVINSASVRAACRPSGFAARNRCDWLVRDALLVCHREARARAQELFVTRAKMNATRRKAHSADHGMSRSLRRYASYKEGVSLRRGRLPARRCFARRSRAVPTREPGAASRIFRAARSLRAAANLPDKLPTTPAFFSPRGTARSDRVLSANTGRGHSCA
jgi:hypothetical protein